MKPLRTAVFFASLALNAVLALVFIVGAASASSGSALKPAVAPPRSAARPPPATPALDATVWPRLYAADDLPGLVARLRAEGFPPAIIRGIIGGLLQEKFLARRQALDPDSGRRPYWKTDRPPDPKLQLALRELDREQRRAFRELLGPDAAYTGDDPFMVLYRRREFAGLPPEQAQRLQQLTERYDLLQQDVYSASSGTLFPTERARLAELEKEKRAAIVQVLSPGELEAYDLRASGTAQNLRGQLGSFAPTEAEFLAIYRLRRPIDEQFDSSGGSSPDEQVQQQRAAAEKILKEQIKAALGPDRYAEYERNSDYGYRQAALLVARLDLPPATTPQLWSVQQDIQQRADSLRADRTLTEAQRTAQLTALVTEATARVTATLGPRGLNEYQHNGGWWLRELTPPQPPKN